MKRVLSLFHSRSLWIFYSLFFTGSLVLVYQAFGWSLIGDSVNFLCVSSALLALTVRRWHQIIENSVLITAGYILPLLIRNCIKLSYAEAPSTLELIRLGAIAAMTTMIISMVFSGLGFSLNQIVRRTWTLRKRRLHRALLKNEESL